mmetsp:Transcript_24741/g.35641  ORF Transcript_24741/g.35641 Transcript_24741/m.35641 type:complete len:80 (+) Transcript_24741:1098-1337(+)
MAIHPGRQRFLVRDDDQSESAADLNDSVPSSQAEIRTLLTPPRLRCCWHWPVDETASFLDDFSSLCARRIYAVGSSPSL